MQTTFSPDEVSAPPAQSYGPDEVSAPVSYDPSTVVPPGTPINTVPPVNPLQAAELKVGTNPQGQSLADFDASLTPQQRADYGPSIRPLSRWEQIKDDLARVFGATSRGNPEAGTPTMGSVVGSTAMLVPLGMPETLGKLLMGYFTAKTAAEQPAIGQQILSEIQNKNYSAAKRDAVLDALNVGMMVAGGGDMISGHGPAGTEVSAPGGAEAARSETVALPKAQTFKPEEVLPPPTGQPAVAIASPGAKGNVKDLTGGAPQAQTPIPEAPATLEAQTALTRDPAVAKAVTLVTPGAVVPENHGLVEIQTKQGTALVNPIKVDPAVAKAQLDAGGGGKLMGFSTETKPDVTGGLPTAATVLQTKTADGTVIQDEVVTPTTLPTAVAAGKKLAPGGSVEIKSPQAIIQERQAAQPAATVQTFEPEEVSAPAAKIEGLGGAIPAEFASDLGPTGIKNATVDAERQARGLPPAMATAKRGFGVVWDQAMAKLDRDPDAGVKLVDELAQQPRAVNDDEGALLLHRQIDLQHQYERLTREEMQARSDAAPTSDNPAGFPLRLEDAAAFKQQREQVGDQLLQLYDVNKFVGTETARGLAARRMMADADYSYSGMETAIRSQQDKAPLSPRQEVKTRDIADKNEQGGKDVDEAQKKFNDELKRQIPPQRSNGMDAETKRALDAANKVVRENAARLAEAENKQRVTEQELENQRARVQEDEAQRAVDAANKVVRDNAARRAREENKARVRAAESKAKAAKVKVDAARKAHQAAVDRARQTAIDTMKQAQRDLAHPEIRIWNAVKGYLDAGAEGFDDIRNKVATDLGLPVKRVTDLILRRRQLKMLADDVWRKQQALRRFQEQAKRWVRTASEPIWEREIRSIPRYLFGLKVGFHGTVALGTHAPAVAFQPPFWASYIRNFGKMYRMVGSPVYYERQLQDLVRRPNYITARRAGLVNDPATFEDYNSPDVAQYIGRLSGMGNRGYFVLKLLRQDMFDQHWNALPHTAQTPEVAKAIADGINHATGVVKVNAPPGAAVAAFAPRLMMSRAAWIYRDPAIAAKTFANWRNATEADKAFAINQVKEKAWVLGTAYSLLALNQGLLTAMGSNQKINGIPKALGGGGFDPMAHDFMKFKVHGVNISYGNGLLTMARLPLRLYQIGSASGGRMGKTIYPDDRAGAAAWQFARDQASPFMDLALSAVLREDSQGRQLPNSLHPEPKRLQAQGIKPYTWPEFWTEQFSPIWAEEAEKEVWQYGLGMQPEQLKQMYKAMATIAVMMGTGARMEDDRQVVPQAPPAGGAP